jgi:Fe-S cluster assembly protein SufD
MTPPLAAADPWVAEFESIERDSREPLFARELRRQGIARFQEMGFPTQRHEDWRATSVAPIAKGTFPAPPGPPPPPVSVMNPWLLGETIRLAFLDGRFVPSLSSLAGLPPEVIATSLRTALLEHTDRVEPHLGRAARGEGHAFLALNSALFRDGAFLEIPRGHCLTTPIHLLFLASGAERVAAHPRNLIALGESSHATVVETWAPLTPGASFTNAVTEIAAAPNASIDHYRVQCESQEALHFGAVSARQARGSNVVLTGVSLGGALARNEVTASLDAPGAACTLRGLAMASGRRHVDNHTRIDHAQAGCESREVYKTILSGRATGVFLGRIHVHPGAQQTDAKQSNHALLLSPEATIDSRPQLEIFADDVKCTHGATVGRLDETALFYLRSRGIPLAEARATLVGAFAADVTGHIRVPAARERAERMVSERLPRAGGAE